MSRIPSKRLVTGSLRLRGEVWVGVLWWGLSLVGHGDKRHGVRSRASFWRRHVNMNFIGPITRSQPTWWLRNAVVAKRWDEREVNVLRRVARTSTPKRLRKRNF